MGEPRPAGGGWQSRLTSCLWSAWSSSSTSYSSSSAALSAPSYASKSCSLALRPSSVWLMDCTPPTSCALPPSCLSRFVSLSLPSSHRLATFFQFFFLYQIGVTGWIKMNVPHLQNMADVVLISSCPRWDFS